jgi:ketosteroid isomerase-like protein
MPWFPDFAGALELARREVRVEGRADPVARYFAALSDGDAHDLELVWPGEVVVHDPRAGVVRGHRQLVRFVRRSGAWLAERRARVERLAATCSGDRAAVELVAHLVVDGREVAWPVAVVAESVDDRSVVFRTYLSLGVVDGRRQVRPPILGPGPDAPRDAVGRYCAALGAGDTEAIMATFAADGYLQDPTGSRHTGSGALRSFFTRCFRAGGGVALRHCALTDDGVRCALEYNCVGWGGHDLPPQAGIAVFERAPGGLLAAVRVYDDVEPPV